jgi:hypothetical protein
MNPWGFIIAIILAGVGSSANFIAWPDPDRGRHYLGWALAWVCIGATSTILLFALK